MGICEGEIKGDPDIAGLGVVLAIFINAGIAIALSWILWLYVRSKSHHRLKSTDSHQRWVFMLRKTLIMQGDSQLITALAIIVASLVNMYKDDETPLYHIFVARSLADACLTGHSSSIILLDRTDHNWTVRLLLLLCILALWEVLELCCNPEIQSMESPYAALP